MNDRNRFLVAESFLITWQAVSPSILASSCHQELLRLLSVGISIACFPVTSVHTSTFLLKIVRDNRLTWVLVNNAYFFLVITWSIPSKCSFCFKVFTDPLWQLYCLSETSKGVSILGKLWQQQVELGFPCIAWFLAVRSDIYCRR